MCAVARISACGSASLVACGSKNAKCTSLPVTLSCVIRLSTAVIALPELGAVMIGAEKAGAAATCGVAAWVTATPCIGGLNSALPPGHWVIIDAIRACCWTSCTASSSIHGGTPTLFQRHWRSDLKNFRIHELLVSGNTVQSNKSERNQRNQSNAFLRITSA